MTSYQWNVDADGIWSTAADWSPKGLPRGGASVVINTADFHTISYTAQTLTIGGLSVGNDDLSVSGGALTVAGGGSFGHGLAVSGTGSLDFGAGSTNLVTGALAVGGGGNVFVLGGGAVLALNGGGSGGPGHLTARAI